LTWLGPPSLSTIEGILIDQLAVAEMASLQSNPLGEDNMQEVLGVGGDYDPDDYEVNRNEKRQHLWETSLSTRITLKLSGRRWRPQKKPFTSREPA